MKKVSILQLKRNTNKLLKQAPLVVTSGGKPKYLLMQIPNDIKNIEDSSLYIVANTDIAFSAEEAVKKYEDIGGIARTTYTSQLDKATADPLTLKDVENAYNSVVRPSLWQRIKNLLTKKVF